jgi:uncharacterized protein YndB with AHSA1/START domain
MAQRIAPIEASIRIDAPPARVWEIVSDQRRMNEWSPEVYRQKFFGEIGLGTRSINLNKRKGFFWPSASKITEFVPEKRLAFYVIGPADTWSYDLAPNGDGTLVTERRELKGGRRSILSKLTAAIALGGIEEHDVELVAGMETTLARIKAEAERTS